MLKLAESEKQEISAAFEEAERTIAAANEAMAKLTETLDSKMACLDIKKIDHIRNLAIPVGANGFKLQCQRYKIQDEMRLDRVLSD